MGEQVQKRLLDPMVPPFIRTDREQALVNAHLLVERWKIRPGELFTQDELMNAVK